MTATTFKLRLETEAARRLRDQLTEIYGDDPELIAGMVEGETGLNRLIDLASKEMLTMKGLATGLSDVIGIMELRMERYRKKELAIKCAIEAAMLAGEIKNMVLPHITLTISKGQRQVVITDEKALPAELMHPPIPPRPDLKAIKAALKAGEIVPGAELGNAIPFLTTRTK